MLSTTLRVAPDTQSSGTLAPMAIRGDRARKRREQLGISQTELGRKIGVSQQTINKIENGQTQHPRHVVELSIALEVSAEYLKGLTDDPSPRSIRERSMELLKQIPEDELPGVLADLKKRASRAGSK